MRSVGDNSIPRASPADHGEARRMAFGLVNGRLFVCVYTRQGDTYRMNRLSISWR